MDLNNVYKELNQKVYSVDLKSKKPMLICDRLIKLYELGMEAKQKYEFGMEAKQEESTNLQNLKDAYIFFKRWIYCADWLQKQRLDKETVKKYISIAKIKDVRNLLQEVSSSIQMEIAAEQKVLNKLNAKANGSPKNNDADISLQLPETPNDEPQPKEPDEITCTELFKLLSERNMTSNKLILVFDVRNEKDYSESRISFEENLIHIPAEKIEPNKLPGFYRYLLSDNESLTRFNKRSAKYTDAVVLMDSNSSLKTMDVNCPLNVFKNSLSEWDQSTDYKRIAILKGGFEEWKNKYPAYVTKPPERKLSIKSDSSDILDSVNYDFLQPNENFTSSPILSGSHRPGVIAKPIPASNSQLVSKNDKNLSAQYNHLSKPYERPITQSLPPSSTRINGGYYALENELSDKQLMISNNIRESKVILQKLPVKPLVDRSNKPNNLGKKSTNEMIAQLERNLKEVQSSIALQQHTSAYSVYESTWSREQLDVLRKQEQELTIELERLRRPQSADLRANKLYPELPSNLSTLSIGERARAPRPLKPSSNEKKENIREPRVKVEPAEVDLPSAPVQMDVDEPETYTEPLNSENQSVTPGLKRSYSSPDLSMKKEGQKADVPEVNRLLKPRLYDNSIYNKHTTVLSSTDREWRLEPIYGSGLHPGITGLKNLGNSCYMNSIIQCLSNTVYLAKYFTDSRYTNDLNKSSDKGGNGYVAEEVAQVIKALWRGQYKSISPRDLKVVVGQYKMQFENYDQQDSHEFLMFLLDWMHNDLKQKSKISFDRPLTVAEKEWEKSMDGQSSIISRLFFGQLRSTIECVSCGKNSTTYETFNSLTMSLPVTNKCTLDDCVKKFVSGQNVSGWKCPNCKVPREGLKKFDIAKLPCIIVIHLNRFGETSGWLEKKNTAVEFPLTNFNLKPYMVQDVETLNNLNSMHYNLYAMSNHYGTMDGGHYTAYCKSSTQNKWYKYDDHTVTEVPSSTVKNQSNSAYLLFYTSSLAEPYLNS